MGGGSHLPGSAVARTRTDHLVSVPTLPDDEGSRSKVLEPFHAQGAKGVTIAVISTVVVFTAIAVIVTRSPGWAEVKDKFFNADVFRESFPAIVRSFVVNVRLFLIAEVLVLML